MLTSPQGPTGGSQNSANLVAGEPVNNPQFALSSVASRVPLADGCGQFLGYGRSGAIAGDSHGIVDRQAQGDVLVAKGLIADPEVAGQVGKHVGDPAPHNGCGPSLILSLRRPIRPAAVTGLVVTEGVDSVEGVVWRAGTHVGQEGVEIGAPAFAHNHATPTVGGEPLIPGVVTTRLRVAPRVVFPRTASRALVTVREPSRNEQFILEASAAPAVAAPQGAGFYAPSCPASALANPMRPTARAGRSFRNNSPSPEGHARQINEGSHVTNIPNVKGVRHLRDA